MFRTTIRSAGAVALLASGALLLTGCSSSGSSSAGAANASPSASASASGNGMAVYTNCLSQHGVTLPTGRPSARPSGSPGAGGSGFGGGFGGGGASMDPTRKAAMQACASLRPQGQGRGGNGGFNSTAMQAFTSCMKDHGVTLPTTGGMRALNTADPATAAAYKICQPLMPARSSADPSASATSTPTA